MPEVKRTQAYAVVYESKGQFLIAKKLEKGYFFSTRGGQIVKRGKTLNGSNKYALPGGQVEPGETHLSTAKKEFEEETGQSLTGRYDEVKVPAMPWDGGTFNGTHFYYIAAYFKVQAQVLSELISAISTKNLPASQQVVDAILNGTKVNNIAITQYRDIKRASPMCPADNELASVAPWDLSLRWDTIAGWMGDQDLGWYYTILKYLKETILHI